MNEIPHYTGLQAMRETLTHTQHLDSSYRLTRHERQGTVVVWLSRVDSQYPGGIQWLFPIESRYQRALEEFLQYRPLEMKRRSDGIINP
jgi:hypothetical protein